MAQQLKGSVIAALVTNGFEETALATPTAALEEEGARVVLVAPQDGDIRSLQGSRWYGNYRVDKHLDSALPLDFDALLLPGGAVSCDTLENIAKAVKLTGDFIRVQKPVAAICHAPRILAKTGIVKGRSVTSHPSVKEELQRAGASWTNQELVVDGELVTCRSLDSLPAFNVKLVQLIHESLLRYQVGWGT